MTTAMIQMMIHLFYSTAGDSDWHMIVSVVRRMVRAGRRRPQQQRIAAYSFHTYGLECVGLFSDRRILLSAHNTTQVSTTNRRPSRSTTACYWLNDMGDDDDSTTTTHQPAAAASAALTVGYNDERQQQRQFTTNNTIISPQDCHDGWMTTSMIQMIHN
jgi:hypothetical protein